MSFMLDETRVAVVQSVAPAVVTVIVTVVAAHRVP